MIQLKNSRGRLELLSRAIIPTPVAAIEDGKITDPRQLIGALSQLKQKYRWHSNRINLCLGSQAFYIRRVKLPPLSDNETAKAMRWEIERHFPLTAEEAVLDYCPLNNNPHPSAREYLLAAAPKETADSYADLVESAGFRLQALEILPLSLLRSYLNSEKTNHSKTDSKNAPCRVLLDFGFKDSSILITRGSEYQLYRSLKTGIDHFCRTAIKGGCKDFQAAQRKIYARGTLAEKGLMEVADQLTSKIIQSFNYYTEDSSPSELVLHSLDICGGGAFIPGLATYLEQKTAIRPSLYNPLSSFTGSSLSRQPETFREEAFFPAAHGLALRGWIK